MYTTPGTNRLNQQTVHVSSRRITKYNIKVMHIVKVEKQQYEIYQYMVKMGMVGGKIGRKSKHVCTRHWTNLERLCLETLSPDMRVGDA